MKFSACGQELEIVDVRKYSMWSKQSKKYTNKKYLQILQPKEFQPISKRMYSQ